MSASELVGENHSVPICPKNWAETDERAGLQRMQRLVPYACSRMGKRLPDGSMPDPDGRLSLRKDAARLSLELSCGAEKIRAWVRLICERGIENVRASDFLKKAPGGGKGKCKVRKAIREPLFEAIAEVCVKRGFNPGTRAANKAIRAEMQHRGVPAKQLPSRKALKSASTAPEILRLHTASVEGEHMCRVLEMSSEATGLNQVVLMDGTMHSSDSDPAECLYALDEFGRILGLVNSIYGLDAATRGVWSALPFVGAANTFLSNLCIHRGLLAKDALLAKYGIPGIWPWCGRPARFVTDRGKEFIGRQTQGVLKGMGIGFTDRSPPRIAYFRAKGERFNRTAHELFAAFMHSEVGKKYFRPVPGKPQATGILFKDLDRANIEWVVSLYHGRANKGLGGATPLERFFDMVNGEKGFPLSGFPAPVADRPELMWDFLWETSRVINHVGISIDNRTYSATDLTQFLAPGKRSSITRHSIRFNPYDLGNVFVRRPGDNEILRIPYVHRNETLPMSSDQRRHAYNPSIWEWRAAYTDLKRVGIEKPTSEQMMAVIQGREEKILDPEVAISSVLTQRDVSNLEMRKAFASNQPGARDPTLALPTVHVNPRKLPRQTPALLPVGRGGADEY